MGLVVANLIESMNWTNRVAWLARPLVRLGHMSSITGASFMMSFFSGVSANTILAEAFDTEKLNHRELVLANLFNSLPRYFLHLPTVFFLTVPLIKSAALIYVSITFTAALLQTMGIVLVSRLLLQKPGTDEEPLLQKKKSLTLHEAITKSLRRLKKRMVKITMFMVPVYIVFYLLGRWGIFDQLEELFASARFLGWLAPQSLGIVILHVTTEFSAGLAAASSLLASNSLSCKEVVLALLTGNILAAPVRALRHQLPYYLGIFPKRLAIELVVISQISRATCIIMIGLLYYLSPM